MPYNCISRVSNTRRSRVSAGFSHTLKGAAVPAAVDAAGGYWEGAFAVLEGPSVTDDGCIWGWRS
ncbi:hypothetical protein PG995_013354 [Apiospora arundinis]